MSYLIEKLKSWQLAYIAGIIDGEGSLSLYKQTKGNSLYPAIMVKMTSAECVNLLYTMTGIGRFYTVKLHEHYKQQYRWDVRNRLEVYLFLRAIRPYLVVKREHATLLLEFVERRIQGRLVTGRDFELQAEIHKLNS